MANLHILFAAQALRAWNSAMLSDNMLALTTKLPQCRDYIHAGAESAIADGWSAMKEAQGTPDFGHVRLLLQNRANQLHITLPDLNSDLRAYAARYAGRYREAQVLAPSSCTDG